MNRICTYLFSSLLLVGLCTTAAVAQDSGGPVPDDPSAAPTAVPLDGGASLLLASGVAYGLKRLRQRKS